MEETLYEIPGEEFLGDEELDTLEARLDAPEEPAAKPLDYRVKMSKQEREDLARMLCDEIDRYYDAASRRLDNCEQWRIDYEQMPDESATLPWDGASQSVAPFTRYACDAHHTRLNSQIISENPVTAVPMDDAAIQHTSSVEDAMNAKIEESEWAIAADELHSELPKTGNAVIRVTYERDIKRVPFREVETDDDAFEALIAAGIPPAEASWQSLKRDAQGRPVTKLQFRDDVTFEGVKYQVIPFEDAVLLPPTVRDPLEARGIGERVMVSGVELENGAKSGKFIAEEVREVMAGAGDELPDDRRANFDYQGIEPDEYGTTGLMSEGRYRNYLCYELDWWWDANGDGVDELLWITLHHATRRILRIEYSRYEHGEPKYHWFPYLMRAREPFGGGVAEVIATHQDTGNAIRNMLLWHGEFATNVGGNIVVDDTAGLDPKKFRFQMNVPVRVKELSGFTQLQPLPLPSELMALYQSTKDEVDLVAGTSNPSLGKATDTQRTLGEVQLVANNANAIFEETAKRVARRWSRVWEQVRALEVQFATSGSVKYRKEAKPGALLEGSDGQQTPAVEHGGEMVPAPGGMGFVEVPAEALMAKIRLVPSGLKQLSDMNSRLQQALLAQKTLMENPLTANIPEVQELVLQEVLHAMRFPAVRKVMDIVGRALKAQQLVGEMQLAVQQQQQEALMGAAQQPGADLNPDAPPLV